MNHLGQILREMFIARKLRDYEVADKMGISCTALSKIMQGHNKPRQSNFSRLCEVLKPDQRELDVMVALYTKSVDKGELDDDDEPPPTPLVDDAYERLRIERFMEIRTQSIAFRNAVGRELQKLRIPYMKEFYEDAYSCDFMLDPEGRRIAVECKFNTTRDFPKSIGLARLLIEKLGCEKVLIVVPYKDHGLNRYHNPDPEHICITEPYGIAALILEQTSNFA